MKTLSQASSEEHAEFDKAILDSAIDGIITINTENEIVDWNAAAEKIFLASKSEMLGKPLYIIMPQEFHSAHKRGMDHWRKTEEGPILRKRIEVEALRLNGERFHMELAVSPFVFKGDTYFTARVRDISQRKIEENILNALVFELDHRVKNTLAIV